MKRLWLKTFALILALCLLCGGLVACNGASDSDWEPSQETTRQTKAPSSYSNAYSDLVWIPTNGGVKYHKKESCSGMKDPIQTTKERAIRQGFDPCQKCF